MDLSDLFPIARDLEIKMPDGTPTGIVLKVVGQDSKEFRNFAKRIASQVMSREDKVSVDELEKQGAEAVAACIVGWTSFLTNGEPLPYSPEKAIELMATPELAFVREQVEAYVTQRANFFRPRTEKPRKAR
jgi:hypothetical protein